MDTTWEMLTSMYLSNNNFEYNFFWIETFKDMNPLHLTLSIQETLVKDIKLTTTKNQAHDAHNRQQISHE